MIKIKLSPYHEIFYNEWRLDRQRSDYNIVIDNKFEGKFDSERLNKALERLSEDYLLLHSCIREETDGYYWFAKPELKVKLDYFENPQSEKALLAYVQAPFDLENGPLLRVALIRLEPDCFRLIIVGHHIILDGGKVNFIFETIPQYYNTLSYKTPLVLEKQIEVLNAVSRKFEDWIKETEKQHFSFWEAQLTDIPGIDFRFLTTSHSSLLPLQIEKENPIGEFLFQFNNKFLERIQTAARKYGITPYLLSQSIFAILLYRHTQQEKFAFCFPTAILEGLEFVYGVHISPTIIPYHFNVHSSVQTVLEDVKKYFKAVKAGRHHYFPIQKALLTFINKSTVELGFTQTNLKNQLFDFIGIHNQQINTNLNIDLAGTLLFAQELKTDCINYRVMYKKEKIDPNLLSNFIDTYQRLSAEILEDLLASQEPISIFKYRLVDNRQYELLIRQWNNTEKPYSNKTLIQLFEDQVFRTPDATAIVYENATLTYSELNEQSNQLAHYLKRAFSPESDNLFVLCLKPSELMLVGLWAVLKSGAAYVPVDPNYPDERIHYILQDTRAKALLTDAASSGRLNKLLTVPETPLVILNSSLMLNNLKLEPKTNPVQLSHNRHLAYVIYTSGTTGQPKGVLVEHHSIVNYASYLIEYHKLSEKSVGAKYAAFSFDASVIEIYPILLSGGKLCLVSEEERNEPERVNSFFHAQKITYAFLPTPFAEIFFELKNTCLKNLIVGGDKLRKFISQGYTVMNAYGPTEATVQSTAFLVNKSSANIPIGKPINNFKCYVVDSQLNLLPIGSLGELLIGGEGLARGYLNQPELTNQQFIFNPFQTEEEKKQNKNERLYKTGDLVRWLPDGNLEYSGRNDSQVKIRGYRIELGEIEARLLTYPNIKQAIVTVFNKKAGDFTENSLVAYYVSDSPNQNSHIAAFLAEKLPYFMLPSCLIQLKALPLTQNGKLDKTQLPKPEWDKEDNFVPPTDSLEIAVCSVYSDILELDKSCVGIHSDFFGLGGDSLLATQLVLKLKPYLNLRVTDIFKWKTPANLIQQFASEKTDYQEKLFTVKDFYQKIIRFALRDVEKIVNDPELNEKYKLYQTEVQKINPNLRLIKPIKIVLLTGATGHLGCNILAKLLSETPYTVYLPVRASSDEKAYDRVNEKFQYYFETNLAPYETRVKIFAASLEEENLGLSLKQYNLLCSQVDSVIHCASMVKYYGFCYKFYQSNIQPTIHLLQLSEMTSCRDFHYISTVGVFMNGYVRNKDYYIFTEQDDARLLVSGNHSYIQSKCEAEELVRKYRNKGLNANIYRVGNLVMHSVTHRIQQNFEENIFFNHIKAMLKFKILPEELSQMEVSPVDQTALAIVKLFDKAALSNQTHHVFNSKSCNIKNILVESDSSAEWEFSFEKFVEKTLIELELNSDNLDKKDASLLRLYQLWAELSNNQCSTQIYISQEKTKKILTELDFCWPTVTKVMFKELINKTGVFN